MIDKHPSRYKLEKNVSTVIILHFDRQFLGNKLSFTICSIYILFNSNEFYKFWMGIDFRSKCAKNGRKWAKSQADWLGTSTNTATSSIKGHNDMSTLPLHRELKVGLIK